MFTEEQVKPSEEQQEQSPTRVAPLARDDKVRARDSETGTKTVTKQKDPKRVAIGRQLGLKSKEYKLKKQEMMKSDKQVVNREDESPSVSKTPFLAAGGVVVVLGLGYFFYTKFKSSLRLPTLTPTLTGLRVPSSSFNQETRR